MQHTSLFDIISVRYDYNFVLVIADKIYFNLLIL